MRGRVGAFMREWGPLALFIGLSCSFPAVFIYIQRPIPVSPSRITLDDLTDVIITETPKDGQMLLYDPVLNKLRPMYPWEVKKTDNGEKYVIGDTITKTVCGHMYLDEESMTWKLVSPPVVKRTTGEESDE